MVSYLNVWFVLCIIDLSQVSKWRMDNSRIAPIFMVSMIEYIVWTEDSYRGNVLNKLLDFDAWFAKLVDFRDVLSVWGGYEPCMGSNPKWSDGWFECCYIWQEMLILIKFQLIWHFNPMFSLNCKLKDRDSLLISE